MAALTLLESAKLLPAVQRALIETYASSYAITSILPVFTAPSGVVKWNVESDLPYAAGSGKRNVNADFTTTQGKNAPQDATAKVYGGETEIDRYIKATNPASVVDQRMKQIRALAREYAIDVFEGDGGTAIRGVDWYMDNDVLFYNQRVTSSNAGTASAGATLSGNLMDRLLDKVSLEGGSAALFMSQRQKRKLSSLNRGNTVAEYNVVYPKGDVGMPVTTYAGVPIYTMVDGKGNDILSTTLGDSSSSSVYLISMGDERVSGFQVQPMNFVEANDGGSGEFNTVEWYAGLKVGAIRSVGSIEYVSEA